MVAGLLMCCTTYFAWLFGQRYGSDLQKPYLADDGSLAHALGVLSRLAKRSPSVLGARFAAFCAVAGVYRMFSGISRRRHCCAMCCDPSIDIGLWARGGETRIKGQSSTSVWHQ